VAAFSDSARILALRPTLMSASTICLPSLMGSGVDH
jgi:hypothetical protein